MGIENPQFEVPIQSEDQAEESGNNIEKRIDEISEKTEKSFLDKFKGRVSKVANAMMLASALSGAPGVVKDVEAQVRNSTKTEDVKKEGGNITESGSWAKDMIKSVKEDVSKLKTAEDAEWFLRRQVGAFIGEWHQPTKGNIKEGAYGLKERVSTDDDLDLILDSAKEMNGVLEQVNEKFPNLPSYENKKGDLRRMINSYEDQTSYAGKQKRKVLDDYLK